MFRLVGRACVAPMAERPGGGGVATAAAASGGFRERGAPGVRARGAGREGAGARAAAM
jgi:hypothetical protein